LPFTLTEISIRTGGGFRKHQEISMQRNELNPSYVLYWSAYRLVDQPIKVGVKIRVQEEDGSTTSLTSIVDTTYLEYFNDKVTKIYATAKTALAKKIGTKKVLLVTESYSHCENKAIEAQLSKKYSGIASATNYNPLYSCFTGYIENVIDGNLVLVKQCQGIFNYVIVPKHLIAIAQAPN
jgi:hypothetical protein